MREIFRLRTWARHIVFLPLGAAASASIGNGLEDNIERSGMDLRRIELPEGDPALCQSACLGDAQCQSFTYAKPGTHAPRAMCYLKSGEPTGTPNDCCISGLRPTVTPQTAQSVLYQAYQALQAKPGRLVARSSADGQHDTLAQYAAKCDAATGITIPSFNCSADVEPADQGNGSTCNTPNVLNGTCDPAAGFKFFPAAMRMPSLWLIAASKATPAGFTAISPLFNITNPMARPAFIRPSARYRGRTCPHRSAAKARHGTTAPATGSARKARKVLLVLPAMTTAPSFDHLTWRN